MKTSTQIHEIANKNCFKIETIIPSKFKEVEYLAVTIKPFVTAFFLMNNETFNYTFSHVYNAKIDKTTKKLPKMFN